MLILNIIGWSLAVIGIFFTIYFGVLMWKYPKRIKFYVLDAVRMTDPLVDKTKNIKLEYDGKKITNTISYIKMLLCNVGNADIELGEQPSDESLSIRLPKGYKWLKFDLIENSDKLRINLTKDNNDESLLHVNGGVFKREELFTLEALVEGELTKQQVSDNKLTIEQRFCNAEKTKTETMYDLNQIKETRFFLWISAIVWILLLTGTFFMAYTSASNTPVRFLEKNVDNDTHTAFAAYVCENDSIAVVEDTDMVWPWTKNRYSLNEFCDKYEVSTYISKESKAMAIVMIFVSVLFVFFIALTIWGALTIRVKKKVSNFYTKLLQSRQKE